MNSNFQHRNALAATPYATSHSPFDHPGIAGISPGAFAGLANRLLGFAASAIAAVRRWYTSNRNFNELAALDDSMLKDIGISRSDIPSISRLSARDPYFWARDLSD